MLRFSDVSEKQHSRAIVAFFGHGSASPLVSNKAFPATGRVPMRKCVHLSLFSIFCWVARVEFALQLCFQHKLEALSSFYLWLLGLFFLFSLWEFTWCLMKVVQLICRLLEERMTTCAEVHEGGCHSCVHIPKHSSSNGYEAINIFCFICKLCLQLSQHFQDQKKRTTKHKHMGKDTAVWFFPDSRFIAKTRNQH